MEIQQHNNQYICSPTESLANLEIEFFRTGSGRNKRCKSRTLQGESAKTTRYMEAMA